MYRFHSAGCSAGKIAIIVAHLDLKLSIGKLFTPFVLQPDVSSWLIAVADKKEPILNWPVNALIQSTRTNAKAIAPI
jgi:hypothetical protein